MLTIRHLFSYSVTLVAVIECRSRTRRGASGCRQLEPRKAVEEAVERPSWSECCVARK